jgi:hypothetical protein
MVRFTVSKISCVSSTPKGVGLFEIFGTGKKRRASDVLGLKAEVYFFLYNKVIFINSFPLHTRMLNKQRCQSCGMALGFPLPEEYFGTNADGTHNKEYCQFCFKGGQFTKPDLTLQQMIDLSIEHMTTQLEFPKEKAERLANEIIPQLKRWKN